MPRPCATTTRRASYGRRLEPRVGHERRGLMQRGLAGAAAARAQGKYIDVHVDGQGRVVGARITNCTWAPRRCGTWPQSANKPVR